MSSYSVDKLLGVLDAPNSQAELAAAVGGFLKELDTMAKTNSKGYGNLLKEMGEKAGVQLPEDFVQRVAGPVPPELEPMPLTASVLLARPADVISTSHPTIAILHFRAAPKGSQQLPPPLQPPPPGSSAADVTRWQQACQFAMRQWREAAVEDTTAKPAANNAKLTPSAAASSSSGGGSSSGGSTTSSSLLPPLPSFPPAPPSLVPPGEHRVKVHFFLEVHPVTVKFAVEETPPSSCWLLVAQACRWLQQQALPPKFKAWGPLKFDPDVGKLRCQVHPQWLPRDKVAAATAAMQQRLKADALQGTSAASLPEDLKHQLLLDPTAPSSTGDSQVKKPSAGAASSNSSSKQSDGGGVTGGRAALSSTAGRLQAGSSSKPPASAASLSSSTSGPGSGNGPSSSKPRQAAAAGPRRPLIQVMGSDAGSDSDDTETELAAASKVPAAAGRSLVEEVVSAAAAAGSGPPGSQESGQEGGAAGLQLGGMLKPKGQRQEEGLLIKAVSSRKVQQPQPQPQPQQQQQQQQRTLQPVEQPPALGQEQQRATQQASASYKVGFVTRGGTRLVRVLVTGVPAASAASLQVEAVKEQQLLQLSWAASGGAAAAAGGGQGVAASKQEQPQKQPQKDVGNIWGDASYGIEALAALLDGRKSGHAAAGSLGADSTADEEQRVRDQQKQQQQGLAVRLPPVAVGTWSAKFEAKHNRLVLEAAVDA